VARTRNLLLLDRSGSSTECWCVLSLQLRSDESSSQCAPVGPSTAWWNDQRNDLRRPLRISSRRSNAAGLQAASSGDLRAAR
jgi:hypothetical protein